MVASDLLRQVANGLLLPFLQHTSTATRGSRLHPQPSMSAHSTSSLTSAAILSDLSLLRSSTFKLPPQQSHNRLPSRTLPNPITSAQLTPNEAIRQSDAFLASSEVLLKKAETLDGLGERIDRVLRRAEDIEEGLKVVR